LADQASETANSYLLGKPIDDAGTGISLPNPVLVFPEKRGKKHCSALQKTKPYLRLMIFFFFQKKNQKALFRFAED
jgi:hypothetical protein